MTGWHAAAGVAGVLLILAVLWDAFETILLPRRAAGRLRVSRFALRTLWTGWAWAALRVRARARREHMLSVYAQLSLIAVFVIWAAGLIVAFGLLLWAWGSRLTGMPGRPTLLTDLYMSGTTFFTLGLGDVAPASRAARVLVVVEAGTGFGFLALGISYLPVLYQLFSRREARITMLDEWAGSPPTAAALLRRQTESEGQAALVGLLHDWEIASAELLESHLSYPILAFFRSQHDNQSWLASLVTVLDACAILIVGVEGLPAFQARLTFAIGRHALVDLSQVLRCRPDAPPERLPAEVLPRLRESLAEAGLVMRAGAADDRRFAELRALYEPYAAALSRRLLMPLPGWLPEGKARFNWQTTAWSRHAADEAH